VVRRAQRLMERLFRWDEISVHAPDRGFTTTGASASTLRDTKGGAMSYGVTAACK